MHRDLSLMYFFQVSNISIQDTDNQYFFNKILVIVYTLGTKQYVEFQRTPVDKIWNL